MHEAIGETAARGAAPRDEGVEAAMRRAAAEMGPDWTVVRGRAAKKAGERGGAVFLYAFMHPRHGVALVGAEHDPGAVARFKHEFAAVGFAAVFGGCPPVVYRALPPPHLPLGEVLQAAFALEPAPALPAAEEQWLEAARRVIAPPVLDEAAAVPPPDTGEAREPASAEPAGVPAGARTEQTGTARRQRGRSRAFVLACVLLAPVLGGGVVAWHFEPSEPGHGVADAVQPAKETADPEPSAFPQDTAEACASDARACGYPAAPPSGHAARAGAAPDSGRSDAGTDPIQDAAGPERQTVQSGRTLAESAKAPSPVADASGARIVPYPAVPSDPETPGAGGPSVPGAVRDGAGTPDGPGPQEAGRPSWGDSATSRRADVLHDESGIPNQAMPTVETAVPSTAAAPSAAQSATTPQRPLTGASPAVVAALLARGDALIAVRDVAAARLVYQRAAALASSRAATATGRTFDPRFLHAIGAIGVVADPDAAAAWYRKGAALGDGDAEPLLGGLDVKESR